MALFGPRAGDETGDSPALGMGPDYYAPETTSPAGEYSPPRIHDERSGMAVPDQWDVYDNGRDQRPPDTERIERSRRDEKFIYNSPGPVSDEHRKAVRPDDSYYDPPPNPRIVRQPRDVAFTRTPFGHGFAPELSGEHFSMASNMRAYEIYGQGANYQRRINTLRAEPAPMDLNTYDSSAPAFPNYGVFESTESRAYSSNFRLG